MGQTLTILCHGDSITQGCWGRKPDYPYSHEILACLTRDAEITTEGYPGFGTKDLRNRLQESLQRKSQDIVCTMGGTNDLLMTPAAEIIEVLKETWQLCLQQGSRVVALTVPEGQLGPDFHENQLELNRLIRKAVEAENDSRLTMYDACGSLPTQESRPDLWNDQVHPTMAGYKVLGQGLGMYLESLLQSIELPAPERRTIFRPCIDLHAGVVKQIVGGTLANDQAQTNYISAHPASYFAELYRKHDLDGGHVIMLGPNCTEAARSALQAWPGKLQIGGGINASNANEWLSQGAEKLILTSWLFPDGQFSLKRLQTINEIASRERLVIDLSCRANKDKSGWTVAMNKWQTLTTLELTIESLDMLQEYCSEFLIHAADVEGLQSGVDQHLVEFLGLWAAKYPDFRITYAGGARNLADLDLVNKLSQGRVDLTIGSALDIFGGDGVKLIECVEYNNKRNSSHNSSSEDE